MFVDLTNAGRVRGAQENADEPVAQLPRKLDEIHLTLPRFRPAGRYAVAILQSKSERTAVALGSANATGTEQRATLIVTLDLSEARPGKYYLGTRLLEEGQQRNPSYYAVFVG